MSAMGEGMTFTKTPTRAHLSLFLAIEKLTKEPQCVSLRHLRLAESGKEVKMSMNRKKQDLFFKQFVFSFVGIASTIHPFGQRTGRLSGFCIVQPSTRPLKRVNSKISMKMSYSHSWTNLTAM